MIAARKPAFIALLLVAIVMPLLAPAGFVLTGAYARQADIMTVTSQDVQIDFPTGMTFSISASFEEPVDRASLLFAVGASPTMFQTSADLAPGQEQAIDLPVKFQLFGIPPGVSISYHWRFHTVSGEIISTEPRDGEWIDTRFDWQLIQTENFNVYSYSTDEALHQRTADVAQETFERYRGLFQGPERSEPVMVWLYNSQNDLHGSLLPNSREWIGGVSYAHFSLITAVVPPDGESTMLRVVPHEVVHQALDDATENPFSFPATWFDEGVAGLGQSVGTENFDQIVELALLENRLPTIRSLIGKFGAEPVLVRTSYAASYSIVTFLIETRGEEVILHLIEAYRDGLSHAEVLQRVLGMTVDELDIEWRAHLEANAAS